MITTDDERRAVGAATATLELPAGREILQVQRQDFVVDGQDGISTPAGLTAGAPLEANVHVVTGSAASIRDIVVCVNQAGATLVSTFAAVLAASEAVLTAVEKELGVALADVGTGTTGIAIFERGALRHTAVVPIDGADMADDWAPSPRAQQEKLFQLVAACIRKAGYKRALHAGIVLTGGGSMLAGILEVAEQVFDLRV